MNCFDFASQNPRELKSLALRLGSIKDLMDHIDQLQPVSLMERLRCNYQITSKVIQLLSGRTAMWTHNLEYHDGFPTSYFPALPLQYYLSYTFYTYTRLILLKHQIDYVIAIFKPFHKLPVLFKNILCCCVFVTESCLTLLWPPWTRAHQAPLSMWFPRQEYWSGLPFPSPEDQTRVSWIDRWILYCWATEEALSHQRNPQKHT